MYRLLCFAAVLCFSQTSGFDGVQFADPDAPTSASRIVGGVAAPIERYPYTAQLFAYGQFWCGGTLLTRFHVLSAAHCFIMGGVVIGPENYLVRVGSAFIAFDSDGQTRSVNQTILHENYNPVNLDSDLALMLLNASVEFNTRVQPAVLPPLGFDVPYGTTLFAVGWGQTWDNPVSEVLKDVSVRKVNLTECAEAYERRANATGQPYNVTDNMMCSGWPGIGGFDACFGDSGGPLIAITESTHVVVGVTSWGPSNECGLPDYMGVSVRLSVFATWINDTVNTRLNVTDPSGNGAPAMTGANSVVLLTSLLASLVIFKDV